MNDNDQTVKKLQAEHLANLRRELEAAEVKHVAKSQHKQYQKLLTQLVRARLRKQLTQSALANRLNMQQAAIGRIESGHSNPSLKTLLAVAAALDANLVLEYKK